MLHPSQKQITLRSGAVFGGGRLLTCVPLVSQDLDALLRDAKESCAAAPDILEWRADFFHSLSDPQAMAVAASALRATVGNTPILFTPRHPEENGAAALDGKVKKQVIQAVSATGCIDLVDLEMRYDEAYIGEIRRITAEHGVKLILSYHDFSGMPDLELLRDKLRRAERLGADINKLALMPTDICSDAQGFPRCGGILPGDLSGQGDLDAEPHDRLPDGRRGGGHPLRGRQPGL